MLLELLKFVLCFFRSQLTDNEIDAVTLESKEALPNFGERMLLGYFLSKGLRIQRKRIRESIIRVDPDGLDERRQLFSQRIQRRVYSVPHAHYMWHLDGNHKMIRWGLVIHVGIDGFSRRCVYMTCNTNNKSETVLKLFEKAIEMHHVFPCRIRTDYGTENVLVWELMTNHSQNQSGPTVLLGSSVHNERVERFNRDINRNNRDKYARIFYELENDGFLNVENDYDLIAIHYVYLLRINNALADLGNSHNNHCIRTENNHTPNQILAASGYATPTIINVHDPREILDDRMSEEHIAYLTSHVPPETSDDSEGKIVYQAVREYMHEYCA